MGEETGGRKRRMFAIPSFIIRNYKFGYERECTDYLFGGDKKLGAREESAREPEITQETVEAAPQEESRRPEKISFDAVTIVDSQIPIWELP